MLTLIKLAAPGHSVRRPAAYFQAADIRFYSKFRAKQTLKSAKRYAMCRAKVNFYWRDCTYETLLVCVFVCVCAFFNKSARCNKLASLPRTAACVRSFKVFFPLGGNGTIAAEQRSTLSHLFPVLCVCVCVCICTPPKKAITRGSDFAFHFGPQMELPALHRRSPFSNLSCQSCANYFSFIRNASTVAVAFIRSLALLATATNLTIP